MDRIKRLDRRALSVLAVLGALIVSSLAAMPIPVTRAANDNFQPYVLVPQQQVATLHYFSLDSDPRWTTEGAWAWGQPRGGGAIGGGNPDPVEGRTGINVYGYNLNGDYTNNQPARYLQSAALDCRGYTYVALRFWRWLNVERPRYDRAAIEVSNDGSTWTTVWENPAEVTDSNWTPVMYDISSVAAGRSTVYIRWGMGPTDGRGRYSGWNIDDIEILGSNEPFSACDYGPYAIPGRVEAENYRCGGEGNGYHDLTSGHGTFLYRTDGYNVDIIVFADNAYYYLDYLATDEWLEYDVTVAETAAYDIAFRVASEGNTGRMHLEVDRTDVTGSLDVPNTGGYTSWATVTARGVRMTAGAHTLRLVIDSESFTLDSIEFTAAPATPTPTPTRPAGTYCNDLSLGEVTFEDIPDNDGGRVVLRVNNGAGVPVDISSVIVDWQYLDDLDETLGRGMHIWGVYLAPAYSDLGYEEDRCIACDSVASSFDSPSTASQTPRTLPANGGYIVLDYDSDPYDPQMGRLDEPPFNLVPGDLGFSVQIVGCSQPLTRARVPRGTPVPPPSPTPTLTPTPTPTPTSAPEGRLGRFDNFELCPLEAYQHDVRPKPPGLKECGGMIVNPDFEQPGAALSSWVVSSSPAVVASSQYSCSRYGYAVGPNSGLYSMLLRCDRPHTWPYSPPYHPWAYQDFTVPSFISTTEQVDVEMNILLYYLVPAPYRPERGAYEGTLGRTNDELVVVIKDTSGRALTSEVAITHGAIEERGRFKAFTVDMAPSFAGALQDYVGQRLRLWFEAPNPDPPALGDSEFYIDQVRCEVCTTVREPDPEPGRVVRLGGNVRVLVAGQAVAMQGIDVWAMQLQVDGSPPLDELDFRATYTIQDSTYSFYNLNPGRYRIYAEAWISGNLYTASTTVDVSAGDRKIDVNLTLI